MFSIRVGVCISHAALTQQTTQFYMINSEDVILCTSSIYWLFGINAILLGTLNGATRVIYTTQPFIPELQLRLVEKYKVTFLLNAPYQMVSILKCTGFDKTDLSSVKYVFCGGGKMPIKMIKEMKQHLPNGSFFGRYALTETGFVSTNYPTSVKEETAGQLVIGVNIKIIDDYGNRCGIDIDGEICIKNNYKFLGYFNNQQLNDETIDNEGFLRTGDIGHFDEDGYLSIVDRKKDIFKYCCKRISPTDVENFLLESPKIKSACVIGIPDEVAGVLPAAVIICNLNITEQEIYDMVAGTYNKY